MVNAQIAGGGPHDGADIQVPKNCIAIVTIAEMPDGEYVSSLAVRRGKHVVNERIADCLAQLALSPRLQ